MRRLLQFQGNSERISSYKQALRHLTDAGIEDVLQELSRPVAIAAEHAQALQMNAFANQQRLGYLTCIDDLFNLLDIEGAQKNYAERDYGARENLKKAGFTDSELEEIDKEA